GETVLGRVRLGEVGGDGHGRRLQASCGAFQLVRIAADQRDPVTFGGHFSGDRQADALAGSGDHRNGCGIGGGGAAHLPFHSGLRPALKAAWNSACSWVVMGRAWVMAYSSVAERSGMASLR